jgi:hypothetical protein
MTEVFKQLYRSGLSVSETLGIIADEVGTNGTKPSTFIKDCNAKIADEWSFFNAYGATPQDRELTKAKVEPYQNLLAELESKLLNRFYDYLRQGFFVAFGYGNIDNPYPAVIPLHEWNFLEIDKNKDVAYCEGRKYTAIKFVRARDLIEQTKELETFIDNKEELTPDVLAEPQLITEQLEESKIDLENGQKRTYSKQRNRQDNLTKAIKAAILQIGKKPSLDELWQYFQDDKDETETIVDYKDTHITWKTTKGALKDIKKETLANRLSRIKP